MILSANLLVAPRYPFITATPAFFTGFATLPKVALADCNNGDGFVLRGCRLFIFKN
jgi:hypothetical protein